MATGDIVNCSDGRAGIKIGSWAKDKLYYIKKYCDIFNMGMKNIWVTRTYIDLFAGPGVCVVEKTREEIDGSPLVALACKTPFTHYFFNDVNPQFVKVLEERAACYGSPWIGYFNEDCNLAVDEILHKLPRNSLDFCFIDPFNWEISFNAIKKLTKDRKMDLAITFHIGSIKRAAHNPPQELIDFFPELSWWQGGERATNKPFGRLLLNDYESGLRGLGYKEINRYVLEKNTKNVPLYYLIFASKHERGVEFWDKITTRSGTGQLRMDI